MMLQVTVSMLALEKEQQSSSLNLQYLIVSSMPGNVDCNNRWLSEQENKKRGPTPWLSLV
jgi:hypothetical protein